MKRRVAVILEMIKFEHTLFALPLAFAGALAARETFPDLKTWFLVLLAMVGARSVAMAFNRLVDARFDARNPRTKDRAIPLGLVSSRSVLAFIAVSCVLFFSAAALLNPLCLLLSPLALCLILAYSFTKRFTALCHLFLGLCLSVAPVGGWLAVTGEWTPAALSLVPGVMLWVAGFDVLYACLDMEFDRAAGLHSIPAFLGRKKGLFLARLLHGSAWVCFVLAGRFLNMGPPYYLGVAAVGGLLIYEHSLVRPKDLRRLDKAFFTVNSWVSVALFLGVLAERLF